MLETVDVNKKIYKNSQRVKGHREVPEATDKEECPEREWGKDPFFRQYCTDHPAI